MKREGMGSMDRKTGEQKAKQERRWVRKSKYKLANQLNGHRQKEAKTNGKWTNRKLQAPRKRERELIGTTGKTNNGGQGGRRIV